MEKKWCEHIEWTDNGADRYTTIEYHWYLRDDWDSIEVPKNWKVSPICKTPRPKKKS